MGLGMFTLTFSGFPLIGQKVFMSCRETARSGVGTWICEMEGGDSCEGRKGSDTQAEGGWVDRCIVGVDMVALVAKTVM